MTRNNKMNYAPGWFLLGANVSLCISHHVVEVIHQHCQMTRKEQVRCIGCHGNGSDHYGVYNGLR